MTGDISKIVNYQNEEPPRKLRVGSVAISQPRFQPKHQKWASSMVLQTYVNVTTKVIGF